MAYARDASKMLHRTAIAYPRDEIDSEPVEIDLITCPACGFSPQGDPVSFVVYAILGHTHLQCTRCDETYCDGGCTENGQAVEANEGPDPSKLN